MYSLEKKLYNPQFFSTKVTENLARPLQLFCPWQTRVIKFSFNPLPQSPSVMMSLNEFTTDTLFFS